MHTKDIDIEQIVNQLLQDPKFSENEKCLKLLKYLSICSQKHFVPSEFDIAVKVLDKDQSFDPATDASVRVLIWKLRKNIVEYYKKTGKHDKIRLTIPKRHYALELIEKTSDTDKSKKNLLIALFSVILVLSVSLIYILIKYNTLQKKIPVTDSNITNNFIFKDLYINNKPTIIAIGFIYTYCEFEDEINSFRIIRNRLINSDEDLSEYMTRYNIPEKNIWKPTWDSVPVYSIQYYILIRSIFPYSYHSSLNAKISSEIEWSDLLDNNVIFIGHFHNLSKMAQLYRSKYFYSPSQIDNYSELMAKLDNSKKNSAPSDTNIVQTALENQIDVLFLLQHQNTQIDSINDVYKFVYDKKTNFVQDYVILTKLPGPGSNDMLFIISFHQIGRLKVVKMLADPDQMRKFEEQIKPFTPSIPKHFEALIEVKGYKETALEIHVLHFYPSDSQFYLDK